MRQSVEYENIDKDTLLVEFSQVDPVALQMTTAYYDSEDGTSEAMAFIAIGRSQAIQLAKKILEVLS